MQIIEDNQIKNLPLQRAVSMPTPADMLMAAVQGGADIEKLERLMALQERWEAAQAKKDFVAAMAEFKMNAPEIIKDKQVGYKTKDGDFVGYTHATLGNICDVVTGALAKHGISHRWDTKQPGNGLIIVLCILTHKAGHSESTMLEAAPDNSGKKNAIQQVASTVSYLQRYTLLTACGLSTVDKANDDDGVNSEPEQPKEVKKKTLSGKAFENAIASVKAKTYTGAEIRKHYELTPDQDTVLSDVEAGK